MAATLALLAAASLLLLIQAEEIDPLAFLPRPAPATDAGEGKGKKTKPPELYPKTPNPMEGLAEPFIEGRLQAIASTEQVQRETWQAVARMEPQAAANLLGAMDTQQAALILGHLHERELAHIFEQSDPEQATQWVVELLAQPELPPIPEPFREEAKAAGLYDDTAERLAELEGQAKPTEDAGGAAEAPPVDETPGSDVPTGASETTTDDAAPSTPEQETTPDETSDIAEDEANAATGGGSPVARNGPLLIPPGTSLV